MERHHKLRFWTAILRTTIDIFLWRAKCRAPVWFCSTVGRQMFLWPLNTFSPAPSSIGFKSESVHSISNLVAGLQPRRGRCHRRLARASHWKVGATRQCVVPEQTAEVKQARIPLLSRLPWDGSRRTVHGSVWGEKISHWTQKRFKHKSIT